MNTETLTHEEQRAVFASPEYRALEEEYTDLCAVPPAHEVYKGNASLHDTITRNTQRNGFPPRSSETRSVPEGITYPEFYADTLLDFYQAFDRRLCERKSALQERMAAMMKGRPRHVEGM